MSRIGPEEKERKGRKSRPRHCNDDFLKEKREREGGEGEGDSRHREIFFSSSLFSHRRLKVAGGKTQLTVSHKHVRFPFASAGIIIRRGKKSYLSRGEFWRLRARSI